MTQHLDYCVGESKTADGIRKKYRHLFGPDPSIEEPSGKKHEVQTQHRKERLKIIVDNDDHSLHVSDEREEDSDGEVRGRVRGKQHSEVPEESNDNSPAMSSEEQGKVEKVRRKGGKTSAPQTEQTTQEKEKKKGKVK